MVGLVLALVLAADLSFDKALAECQGADKEACLALAQYYADARGPHRDDAKAVTLLQGLCAKNEGEACYQLGLMSAEGRGVPKDEAKANQLWDKACDRGSSRNGCTALGSAYLEGRGGPKRLADGEKLLSATCARDWVPACLRLSRYLLAEAEPAQRDAARGVWLLSQACLGGDVPSCVQACEARLSGNGVPRADADALKDCRNACDGKALRGCWGVAQLNLHTDLPKMSAREAVTLLTRACEAAEPRSCITLGELAEVGGAGVKKSAAVAKDRFAFAHLRLESLCGKNAPTECLLDAELEAQGRVKDTDAAATRARLEGRCTELDAKGCFGLGVARARGHGGPVDEAGALEAWKRGCADGNARACAAAGKALSKAGDADEAKRLLGLACDGWDGEACHELAALSGGKRSAEGKALRKKACRHGYGPACH